MPKVTVHSERFPGVPFAGVPYFAVGHAYEVTDEQLSSIQQQLAGFDPGVKADIRLAVSGFSSAQPAVAIANPPSPPPSNEEELPSTDPSTEDLVELTDEDIDLIGIEVGKLKGKTIAEAEPILIATAQNLDLPKLLRSTYLEEVIADAELQKGLKEIAARLLEQI